MRLIEYTVRLRNADLLAVSAPDDFVLEAGQPVESSRMLAAEVSPYCFDLSSASLLCVSTPDISHEVFFYQAQRRYARSVIKVPFELLPKGPASPTLLFSIGRCGSTLLVRALNALGLRTVSEPDFYRQAAYYATLGTALHAPLAGATGLLPYAAMKLHLECNNAPLLIAGAFPAPTILFILRDPVDWAASLRRISRNSLQPEWAVGLLKTGLRALDQLCAAYAVRICYYEDFRELGAEYFADLLPGASAPAKPNPSSLSAVAARDAQEGTFVSRAALRGVPEDPAFRESFAREWSRSRPAELIDRLGLRFL
jgi:hypothetical protein